MEIFVKQPEIDRYPGIVVGKETKLEFQNEKVTQQLENLKLHSVIRESSQRFSSVSDITVYLKEGEIILFDSEEGYIVPMEKFVQVGEAIRDLETIKELGEREVKDDTGRSEEKSPVNDRGAESGQ